MSNINDDKVGRYGEGGRGLKIVFLLLLIKKLSVGVDVSLAEDSQELIMDMGKERRSEQRLRYHWPVWFAEDFNEVLTQGQMIDVSSRGAAFSCHATGSCPYPGQEVTARFSVPRLGSDDSFDMANFTRSGRVKHTGEVNRFLRRVAIEFAEPLPFKPGEQADDQQDARERLKAITI